jgi:hypothetical protein
MPKTVKDVSGIKRKLCLSMFIGNWPADFLKLAGFLVSPDNMACFKRLPALQGHID